MPLFPQICSLPPTPVFLQYSLWKPDPTSLLPVDRAHACLTVMTQSRLETKRRGNDGFLWTTGKGGGWQLQIRVSPITCSTEIKLSVRLSPSRFNWFYTFLLWWFSGLNNAVCNRLSHYFNLRWSSSCNQSWSKSENQILHRWPKPCCLHADDLFVW